jgi:fido (protein-threonine AMPylation protein)
LYYRLQQGTLATPLERTMAALLPLKIFMRIHRTLLEEAWSFIGRKRLVARR